MINQIEAPVNGTEATYFIADEFSKEIRKEIRSQTDGKFRYIRSWNFVTRVDPASRDEFRAEYPATIAALEAAGVDIEAAAVIYEAHNG